MLRGTRTQYLRRRTRLFFWLSVPLAIFLFSVPVVVSTGWQRIAWAAVLLPPLIFALLLVISRLTDKQWFREQAELQRKMNQSGADAVYLPGWPSSRATEKAIVFAKRLFGRPKSD
jgi:hypothetical protein